MTTAVLLLLLAALLGLVLHLRARCRRMAAAVASGEERLRRVARVTSDAVWDWDLTTGDVWRSEGVGTLFGYAPDAVGHDAAWWLGRVHPDERERVVSGISAVIDGGGTLWSAEYRYRRADDSFADVADRADVIRDAKGQAVRMLGAMTDVSARKRAEAELREQREILAQSEKLAAMGQLLAGVAHELNNPLSAVIARAELLSHLLGEGPLGVHAQKVSEAAERCGRIVKNFLALARRRPTRYQRVHLDRVVREALELLVYRLRVDNVEVVLELPEDLPMLWADPHQLHQVVINIVTNAHQAMHSRGEPGRLTLGAAFEPARMRNVLRIADTGPGIPAAIRARIFEPFYTTKAPGQGTGLGLSLCQSIVEGHGGSIRAEEGPDGGAVFVVELPVEAIAESDREAAPAGAPLPVRGKRILVIDDDAEVAVLLQDALRAAGNHVEIAPNGLVALEKLERLACDVILCDLKMPELDGPGFFQQITRRHPRLVSRIAFLTGDSLSPESHEFIDLSGAPCLAKPFSLGEVYDVIRGLTREMPVAV